MMKKILLVNPAFNIAKEKYDTSISMAVLCLGSYLKEKEIEVVVIDAARQKNYRRHIKEALPQIDCVGMSVMTSQIASALEISKIIKDFNKNIKVFWGGFHPTFFPEQVASHPLVDIALMHEGEEALFELVNFFRGKTGRKKIKKLDDILGIAFFDGKKIKITGRRPYVKFENLPLPRWEIIPGEVLNNLEIVPTHTSRGCPHRCTFCVNAISANLWRWRDSKTVLKDLEIISRMDCFKNKPIRFWDENFFVNIARAKEIVKGIIKRKLKIQWETTIRANYISEKMINDEMLKNMKKSGCYLLAFGAESGSERILKKLKKEISREQIINSAKKCLKYGIIPQYSFMIGMPGETMEDYKKTISLIDELMKMSPEIQILGPQAFRPYPGSTLYEECVVSGWRPPQSLEQWAKIMEDQLNYLSPKQFPWLKEPDFVESIEAYVRFGAHTFKSAITSTVKANKFLKLLFVLMCKLRWKLKFFWAPFDFKLAQKYSNALGKEADFN